MPNAEPAIKVLLLHRPSRSALKQRAPEMKWFSGLFTGHVGIEFRPGKVIDFVSYGRFRLLPNNKNPHSRFTVRARKDFEALLGTGDHAPPLSSLTIPVSEDQLTALENIIDDYTRQPPYDYAFLGMRCASAAYEMLARAGILSHHSRFFLVFRLFTPGLLKQYLRKNFL